eukprot:Em0001g2756a
MTLSLPVKSSCKYKKWGQKLTSPDWVAEGGIHSASNPHPSWANAEFDQKRLTLALVAHKAENKIPGPPSMAEREKSPVMAVETAKVANSPAHMAIGHAVPEEGFLTGTSLEVAEMETSPPSTPNSVAAGELVRTSSEVLAIRLQQDVALPQTLSKLVWGLLSSLRRDTNTNPASSPHGAGEESQTGQLGRAGRSAQPEGEAFAQCSNMLQLAGKSLMTLLVKAGKIQLRINSLKRNLADGLLPPGFAPKPIPFREATEDMKARWRDLDNVFWKQRTELAVVFETENSERANQEVESYLESTTKLLREARCTTLGLQKLAEAWDMAQEESVKIAQHQLENSGTRRRGEDRKADTDVRENDAGPSRQKPKLDESPQKRKLDGSPRKQKHGQAKRNYKPRR